MADIFEHHSLSMLIGLARHCSATDQFLDRYFARVSRVTRRWMPKGRTRRWVHVFWPNECAHVFHGSLACQGDRGRDAVLNFPPGALEAVEAGDLLGQPIQSDRSPLGKFTRDDGL